MAFPPAIDLLMEKNQLLELEKARRILEGFGIISQVSRLGPCKDPLGAVEAYKLSKKQQIGSLKVDTFVNVFQTASDIILQKSIRGRFNLSVIEAMWKGKAVIGGNVGGIKLQIENGKNGFLVSNPKEAAKRITQLIKNPQLAEKLGEMAKETVKEKFLMPPILRDYLKIFKETAK